MSRNIFFWHDKQDMPIADRSGSERTSHVKGHSINCIGCGAPVSGDLKLCSKCCQLLGVKEPANGFVQRTTSADLKSGGVTAVWPLPADRDFATCFLVLSLASVIILGGLTMALVNPFGQELVRLTNSLC